MIPFVAIYATDFEDLIAELGSARGSSCFAIWFWLNREAFRSGTSVFDLSLRALEYRAGFARQTVIECRDELERLGFIETEHRQTPTQAGKSVHLTAQYRLLRGHYRSPEIGPPSPETEPRGQKTSAPVGEENLTTIQEGQEGQPIPPTPQGGGVSDKPTGRLTKTEKKRLRVEQNTPLMVRIGSWFGQKPDTLWSLYQAEALAQLTQQGDFKDADLALLEGFYTTEPTNGEKDTRRHSLSTLLNNWVDELTKAGRWANLQARSRDDTGRDGL